MFSNMISPLQIIQDSQLFMRRSCALLLDYSYIFCTGIYDCLMAFGKSCICVAVKISFYFTDKFYFLQAGTSHDDMQFCS